MAELPNEMLAEMSMSTGKSLPRDAGHRPKPLFFLLRGKFISCRAMDGARYFLATMTGVAPVAPTALQLGLGFCVPEACEKEDLPMIINSTIGQELVPDLRMMSLSQVQVFDPEHLVQPGALFIVAVAVLGFLALIIGLSTCSTAREEGRPPLPLQATFFSLFVTSLRPFLSLAAAVPGASWWSCLRSSALRQGPLG